ncbi:MAG: hypothetical protein Q7V62_07995, partial [Actinomycetota bacterium]|nr:hypothetical protein [Actinomycetota bacterium]
KVPSAAATIQNSTVDDAAFNMPLGSGLNFPLLSTFTECTEAQLLANACPATSRLGNATATVPVLPPNFTGGIYAMKIGSEIEAAVRLNGPRNQYAILRGVLKVDGAGTNSRVVITAVNNPQFPISSLGLTFTQPLIKNPSTCGSQSVTSSIFSHSGTTATPSTTFNTAQCAPNATISGPSGPINDSTPTYTFSDDQGGGNNYEVSIDGGAFAPASTPYTTPALADGAHSICVRANNGVNTGLTVCKDIVVDTVTPVVTITSPAEGATVNSDSPNVAYTINETTSQTCAIDGGAAVTCDSATSHTFPGLTDGAHTAVVTATDPAGNSASDTVNFSTLTGTPFGDT